MEGYYLWSLVISSFCILLLEALRLSGFSLVLEIIILGSLAFMIALMVILRRSREKYFISVIYFCAGLLNIPLLIQQVTYQMALILVLLHSMGMIHSISGIKESKGRKVAVYAPRKTKHLIEKELTIEPEVLPAFDKEYFYYVGSSSSKRYHIIDCRYVKMIPDSNKVMFKNKDAAEKQGFSASKCVS